MDYSEKVMDHFANPRNSRKMEDANGVGTVGNPTCGDLMTIYIKVEDNRFDNVNTDSIKSSLSRRILSPQMKKLRNTLIKGNVGLQYIYDSASKKISIVFSPKELSDSIIQVK